jgi:hypothetical protein
MAVSIFSKSRIKEQFPKSQNLSATLDIDILIVILNSADRYSDIKKIINNLKFEN